MKGDVETNFDTKPSYTVDIIAADSAGATATATLTVNVSSTNSAVCSFHNHGHIQWSAGLVIITTTARTVGG